MAERAAVNRLLMGLACLGTTLGVSLAGPPALAQQSDHLSDLSLEELSNVSVTSVSGRTQPIDEAPAAVFVITADDIDRAGLRSIPGALRLAPNLQIGRIDSTNYGISARGFNQSTGTANKLLVLRDGRIIYTPLFSGVLWDEQNAIMEDLDRIEVISGPGGALWGSNAVNGVINIVSRNAHETTGMLATGSLSEGTSALGLRYGARLGESGAFRIYGLDLRRGRGEAAEFENIQTGFRSDWDFASDAATLQGDFYFGEQEAVGLQTSDTTLGGGNLLSRWRHRFADDSNLEIQAYVDRTERQLSSGLSADVDAAAIDANYTFALSDWHDFIVGGGARVTSDELRPGLGTAYLSPPEETLRTYHLFAQDTMHLSPDFDLILGLKAEDNSYTGIEYMPSLRAAWRPSPGELVWAAVSRAVRTPSRFDRELYSTVLGGGSNFISETLVAYELGYRAQPTERLWFSVSTFYNVYDELRTLELSAGPSIVIRNGMYGETYGLEAWGAYAMTNWWRLNFGLTWLNKDLAIDANSADMFGTDLAGNDPETQISLRSLMDLNERTRFDVTTRYVSELPDPHVPAYISVDMRLSYQVNREWELSAGGYNLFNDHVEFINPSIPARESEQSFVIAARWRH
jgi:iron complex outermembrane receptor protein